MLLLAHHLARSRHGVYYFRLTFPDRERRCGRREFRISLRTRDPIRARELALLIWLHSRGHNLDDVPPMSQDKKSQDELKAEAVRLLTGRDATLASPLGITAKKWISAIIQKPDGTRIELQTDGGHPQERAIIDLIGAHIASDTQATPTRGSDAPHLSVAIARYLDEKKRVWPSSTHGEFSQFLSTFLEVVGDRPVSSIDTDAFESFRGALQLLPPNRSKTKAWRGKTLSQIIEAQTRLPEDKRRLLSPKTLDSYISAVSTFLETCVPRYIAANPAKGRQFLKGRAKKAKRGYVGFGQDELKTIFDPAHFGQFSTPHDFWMPLLGLFTGSRLNELCQLALADIELVPPDGEDTTPLWAFNFNEHSQVAIDPDTTIGGSVATLETQKVLKSNAATRRVPIHPQLIAIGFLEYVDDLKELGYRRLFPYLKLGRRGYYRKPSEDFAKYLDKLGIRHRTKVFHSFRHNVVTLLTKRGVSERDVKAIVGHEDGGVTGIYLDDYGVRDLAANAFQKFNYAGLDLSLIHYARRRFDAYVVQATKQEKRARKRGAASDARR